MNGRYAHTRVIVRRPRIVIAGEPALPTYATVADVLEKKNGSGLRLLAWTIARIAMIAPPMMIVGVPTALALRGAALSSGLISLFTMIRIENAAREQGVRAAGDHEPDCGLGPRSGFFDVGERRHAA